nr:hypothetical protein [Tanacetum cinerariifolium]
MWGMFKREYVEYPELIWEDIAYQIDHRKEKRSRCENMPYPRFTKIIIIRFRNNTSLSPTLTINTIIQSRMIVLCLSSILLARFVPRREKAKVHKERRLLMTLKKLLMYLKSLNLNMNQLKERLLVKRRVKKKVTLSTNDNIISDDLDTTLELGNSISQTKAEEAEAAKQLKGAPSLTPEEQEDADIMQALKESKKISKRQSGTIGSSEGTGTLPRVPNESTVISATSSEGTGTKPGVLDEEKEITKENVILEWGLVKESEHSKKDKLDDEEKDNKECDADDEDDETKSDEDDIYKYKIRVRKDEDEEMINAKVDDFVKDPVSISTEVQQTTTPIPTPTITTEAQIITTVVFESDALFDVQQFPESSKKLTPTINLEQGFEKTLIEDENAMDKGVIDTIKNHRRKHDDDDDDDDDNDDEDPPVGPNQGKKTKMRRTKESESSKKPSSTKETPKGKAPSKGSKTGKSTSTKEPVKEPIIELVMHDAVGYA